MSETVLVAPQKREIVNTNAPFQQEFYECENYRAVKKVIKKLVKQNKAEGFFTFPAPVVFKWKTEDEKSLLEISEDESFENARKYNVSGNSAEIYNLKKDTEYFWRVNGCGCQCFFTDSTPPRWIKADGCMNIRDLGGEKNRDGQTLRQDRLFRGVKLEELASEEGIKALNDLGIRTEIDLRKEAVGKMEASPLGKGVKYISHVCNGYHDFLQKDSKEDTKALIEYFADESNYPIYFHCHGGADRTGTLAFMLGAILGLDDETLIRDYELTMISSPEIKMSRSRKNKIKEFLKLLHARNKNQSLGENAVDFLRECGVTEETLESIRKIMLVI